MRRPRSNALAGIVGVAVALGLAATVGFAPTHAEPRGHVAPWINADGSVDARRVPEVVPVFEADGSVVRRNGREMGVRVSDLSRIDDRGSSDSPQVRLDGAGVRRAEETLESLLVPLRP